MCRNVFWCCYLFIDMINIIALLEFFKPEWLQLKTQTFQCIACCIISQTERDYMYNQWCWYVIYILPLRSSIWGSVVTNCCFKVQPLDLRQLKHLAVSMQWLHCFFGIFSGLLSFITILIFIFAVKNIISLPLIVRGNYIQQELTKHKQTPVSSNLTWCTELTRDCDHIYF